MKEKLRNVRYLSYNHTVSIRARPWGPSTSSSVFNCLDALPVMLESIRYAFNCYQGGPTDTGRRRYTPPQSPGTQELCHFRHIAVPLWAPVVSSLKWECCPPLALLQGFREMMHEKHIGPLPWDISQQIVELLLLLWSSFLLKQLTYTVYI